MPLQLIPVGNNLVPLPHGVSVDEWALERRRYQNPRIRLFLQCIRLLEGILDSNYAILHCSPSRLQEIWTRLLEISDVIRFEVGPSLEQPSHVPALDAACQRGRIALRILSSTALTELERLPTLLENEELIQIRKLVSQTIGKIHAFVQETYCEIIAADPRSLHDADYFMSTRFPRDIEEAEWLHTTVGKLEEYLETLNENLIKPLAKIRAFVARENTVAAPDQWQPAAEVIGEIRGKLTPLLNAALATRGIRFDEMEILDRYAYEVPARCEVIEELQASAVELTDRILADSDRQTSTEDRIAALTGCHETLGRRMVPQLDSLLATLRDLMAFVPLWLRNLERRRALMLHRQVNDNDRRVAADLGLDRTRDQPAGLAPPEQYRARSGQSGADTVSSRDSAG